MLSSGERYRQGSDTPTTFLPVLSDSSIVWIDYVAERFDKEAFDVATSLGFSPTLVNTLLNETVSGYEDLDEELGLLLPAVLVEGFDVLTSPLLILIRKNFVVTIHGAGVRRFILLRRYSDSFMRKIPLKARQQDKVTLLLARLIDENNDRNFDHLREIETHGDHLSKVLSDTNTPRHVLGPEIYNMKHALISYLNALWSTLEVLNNIRYGDAELLTDDPKILRRIGGLVSDVNGQIGLAEHLSEVLASGLEVLQSIYNNQLQILNNKLAMLATYLAVIGTAVLVPNTLATIFSNPAFNMTPKDLWWFAAVLAGSTVVSAYAVYWWIRRSKLLPESPE
ncbi:MAG: CorA family divalent cation transporter [Candidatus Omnitrophica bacterium]|nr:CorA family divalent cation transporter [Candidatus Omnitrophota bacterium]